MGCDWIADGVDYNDAFFSSMDDCQQTCMDLHNYNDLLLPVSYHFYNNYPNPFNRATTLRFDIPENALVNITIYDMMGRVVKTLVNSSQTAGFKSVQWNATNDKNEPVSTGLYLYVI